MNPQIALDVVRTNGKKRYRIVTPDAIEYRRLTISKTGEVMELAQGKRNWGYAVSTQSWLSLEPVLKKISEEDQWIKGWKKVLKYLEASGFWHDVQQEIKDGLDVGLAKIRQANKIPWSENVKSEISKIDPRLTNSFLTSNMSGPPRIKAMRFSKYQFQNDDYKARIVRAIADRKKLSIDSRASYDISFQLNPPDEKAAFFRAWYSEEFKGCGNGHYYLAVDATHALFIEDD